MYNNYTISVIIPCYNEAERLPLVLSKMPECVDEVIVVDNNSTDNTSKVARENNAKVVFEQKKGYGRAHKAGLLHASSDIIFAIDGDGAFSPQYIPVFIDTMISENLDFIWGSRFCPNNKTRMRRLNYIGNKILTFIMSRLYNIQVCDSQSGVWLLKRSLLNELHLVSDGMSFSEEIKMEIISSGNIRFKEVPVICGTNASKRNVILLVYEGIKNLFFLFSNYRRFHARLAGSLVSGTNKS